MTLETPLAGSHRPTFYSSKGVAAIAAGEIPSRGRTTAPPPPPSPAR